MNNVARSGIAVIIDDEVNDESTNIYQLVEEIESEGIPCIKYKSLPDKSSVTNLSQAAFMILDWRLTPVIPGVRVNKQVNAGPNIALIKEVMSKCFCPIFVFTNENKAEVEQLLKDKGILLGKNTDMVMVRNKDELLGSKLFDEVESWIRGNPTVYTLMEWEVVYEAAKKNLFTEFYSYSRAWPKVLWDTFDHDGVPASDELGNMITRNLLSRMSPFQFDDRVFKDDYDAELNEVRSVLAGEKFVTDLPENNFRAGDVFKDGRKFYINIRPDCDCIERNGQAVDLYLLELSTVGPSKEAKIYQKDHGNFVERHNEAIVFNMYKLKTFSVRFRAVIFKPLSEYADKRIGRLLPPHITRILQRYSVYLQREGLPRIPEAAVHPLPLRQ